MKQVELMELLEEAARLQLATIDPEAPDPSMRLDEIKRCLVSVSVAGSNGDVVEKLFGLTVNHRVEYLVYLFSALALLCDAEIDDPIMGVIDWRLMDEAIERLGLRGAAKFS